MFEEMPFHDFMALVRSGDQQAITEFWRRYEEPIRHTIRPRLRDAQLQELMDSVDIRQDVLMGFFKEVIQGHVELASEEHLLRLLRRKAHDRLTNEINKHRAARRDHRRIEAKPVEEIAASDSSPSEHLSRREQLEAALRRLSPQERQIVRLHEVESRGWAEIGEIVGNTPEAVRKQFTRALQRLREQLVGY
jgi:RNA polymerase sigma-70 factor (ECF subfamily)